MSSIYLIKASTNMKKNNPGRRESFIGLDLTQPEIDLMREHFTFMDRQKTGTISSFELRSLFENIGEYHPKDKMLELQQWVEEKSVNKKFDLNLALRAWSHLKEMIMKQDEDEFDVDILNTFVAMGGNTDKTGVIKKQKLVEIIKLQFGLTIDIDLMFEEAGIDTDGDLEYSDFVNLLECGTSRRASRACSIFSQASLT